MCVCLALLYQLPEVPDDEVVVVMIMTTKMAGTGRPGRHTTQGGQAVVLEVGEGRLQGEAYILWLPGLFNCYFNSS